LKHRERFARGWEKNALIKKNTTLDSGTINQKPAVIAAAIAAAIAVETAVVTAAANNVVGDDVGDNDMTWLSITDNGGVDGSGQQHG
jgi:hypothetical protein